MHANTSSKQITNLVNKIVKSRKIQKQRIEGEVDSDIKEKNLLEKIQQPILKELEDNRQLSKTQLAQIEHKMDRRKPVKQLTQAIQVDAEVNPDETDETSFRRADPQWIQNFYVKYRNKAEKATKLEIGYRGEIGNYGKVDVSELMNEGKIKIFLRNKSYDIDDSHVTDGLLGLLLLPMNDMKAAGIMPTKEDLQHYRWIMIQAGTNGSRNSKKYKTFLKGSNVKEELLEEKLEKELTDIQRSRERFLQDQEDEDYRLSLDLPPKRKTTGHGCIPYKKPEQLMHKLGILCGSVNAGNTSNHIRHEIRSILDELLKTGEILPTIHKKFYLKYHL